MSMSQEEIEALMNGLDIADDAPSEPAEESAPTVEEVSIPEEVEVPEDNEPISADEIDALIANSEVEETSPVIEEVEAVAPETVNSVEETISNDDIDDLLKGLEESTPTESIDVDNFDDVLSDIDGIVETSTASNAEVESTVDSHDAEGLSEKDKDEIVKDWTDSKINEGVIPLPAEKDTKVVNQLNQVANDSEEKVGQIFDVLSLGLDNNNDFRNKISDMESYLESQSKLLTSLNQKFPNISVFEQHLSKTNEINSTLSDLKNAMNEEDMKIFEAMELMQFNDINRQKIERVMAVIRKLSLYLNNLFEDDDSNKDIAVAKHIHGDSTSDLVGDDLDKLIAEFGN